MDLKLFSFFSGAGFLDLGFEDEGYTTVYVNEYHAPFLEAYKYSRLALEIEAPEYGYYSGSITDFYEKKLNSHLQDIVNDSRAGGSLVGFIGGPPCPDFSIGGKNRGRHGDHGRLSQTYIDLICQQEPDFFLFENVKGLWRTKLHRQFYEELKQLLWSAGYATTERLTNSIEYGAPQDRERIILLGFRKDILTGMLPGKPKRKSEIDDFPWLKFAKYPNRSAFDFPWLQTTPFIEEQPLPCPAGVPQELTVEHWFKRNKVDAHPNSEHCFKPRAGLARFQTVAEGDDSKKSFKRIHRWRYSPTAAYGNNEVHLHPYKPRRISVAEALAIQSLPPTFTLPSRMTLSDMFKAIGNGVPYLAARMLARSIKTFLEIRYEQNNNLGYCQSNRQPAKESRLQLHR